MQSVRASTHARPLHGPLGAPTAPATGLHQEGSLTPGQRAAPHPLQRLRMIAATAQCWQGMARGSDDFSLLEERRSKLLLASVPPGLGAAAEVAKRFTLWEERRFEDLFRRAEKRTQRDAQPDPLLRADRARPTAAVGAHRKATTGFVFDALFREERGPRLGQEASSRLLLGG